MINNGCVDLMYLACNRLEFTQETFTTLLANTNWHYVHELFVYDDGSQDGTREWLENNVGKVPVRTRFVNTNFGSPVAAMVHFIESSNAPILAKTDNDAMLPPAWLRQSLEVLDKHPELSLLGIEAMYPHQDNDQLVRSYTPAQFISGLGLYRSTAFDKSRPKPYQKWFGLEEWQTVQGSGLIRGWITPAIPVFLLDRIPFDQWKAYSDAYIQRGWQRSWPKYNHACTLWHWRWPDNSSTSPKSQNCFIPELPKTFVPRDSNFTSKEAPVFSVVILSACSDNLIPCVRSVLTNEPQLPPERIIVVNDGARNNAEALLSGIRWVQGIKPFIFSRNVNLGIHEAKTDVILLNDDARLITPRGFTMLSQQVRSRQNIGICSPGIRGIVGNPRQLATQTGQFLLETKTLVFVCVYIPKAIYDYLGPLDEQFIGYGFEDNDYCARAIKAGLQLGIWDGCVVDHGGESSSTFRTRADIYALFQQNQHLFRTKWGNV